MNKKIGMIGLGIMGSSMSANMIKDGFTVVGYGGPRSNAEKLAALAGVGVIGAQSAKEVAEKVDIINTCLPSVKSLEDVVYADDGILAAGNRDLIVIESVCSPLKIKKGFMMI